MHIPHIITEKSSETCDNDFHKTFSLLECLSFVRDTIFQALRSGGMIFEPPKNHYRLRKLLLRQ